MSVCECVGGQPGAGRREAYGREAYGSAGANRAAFWCGLPDAGRVSEGMRGSKFGLFVFEWIKC